MELAEYGVRIVFDIVFVLFFTCWITRNAWRDGYETGRASATKEME